MGLPMAQIGTQYTLRKRVADRVIPLHRSRVGAALVDARTATWELYVRILGTPERFPGVEDLVGVSH
jgi:hypothetical protein